MYLGPISSQDPPTPTLVVPGSSITCTELAQVLGGVVDQCTKSFQRVYVIICILLIRHLFSHFCDYFHLFLSMKSIVQK